MDDCEAVCCGDGVRRSIRLPAIDEMTDDSAVVCPGNGCLEDNAEYQDSMDISFFSSGRVRQERGYIRERIRMGNLYGAFAEDVLIGCIIQHSEGYLGMPYVKAEEEKRGLESSLVAYAVNRLLERGWTPYVQLPAEDLTGAELLESLGFYPAKKTIWRLEKVLANIT